MGFESDTHALADFFAVDGILKTIIAINSATCNFVRNV